MATAGRTAGGRDPSPLILLVFWFPLIPQADFVEKLLICPVVVLDARRKFVLRSVPLLLVLS